MTPYLYLNLPSIESILSKNFNYPDPKTNPKGMLWRYPPSAVFDENFLNYLSAVGINPTVSVIFYRDNLWKGNPHTDGISGKSSWSINWNIGAAGQLHWYKELKIISVDQIYNSGGWFPYDINNLIKTDSVIYDGPMLLRVDIPHSVDNIEPGERWCITLRGNPKKDWESTVAFFNSANLVKS